MQDPSIRSNGAKIIDILVSLNFLSNYFDSLTKLLSHLYLVEFFNILASLSVYILNILIYIK